MSARGAVITGSSSDWETMKEACRMLDRFAIVCPKEVIAAHCIPERMVEFAHQARDQGIGAIIAGAGGAAHPPGMVAARTTPPAIGVPVKFHA